MKKFLLFVVVVLILALVGLPFLGAHKTEETFNAWMAEINQAGTYKLQWERYEKGWLTTDAILKVGFNQSQLSTLIPEAEDDLYIPLNVLLHHGPVLWGDGLGLGWFSGDFFLDKEHEIWVKNNLQVEGDEPFYISRVFMNLVGNTSINDRSLPFTLATSSGEVIQVTAYAGEGSVSRTGLVEYAGNLPKFSVSGDSGAVEVNDIRFHVKSDFGRRVGNFVVPSLGEFSIESASLKSEENGFFQMQNLALSSDMQINAEQTAANLDMKIGFANLDVLGEKVSDAALDIRFANLSVTFLEQYLALIQQSYETGGNASPLIAMQSMSLVTSHLLPAGPDLKIEALKFTTPEGSLNFKGRLAAAPGAAQVASPFEIIPHLIIDTDLVVDKPLAFRLVRHSTLRDLNAAQFEGGGQMTEEEKQALADNQTHMKLDTLTIQGMLIDKGEQYSSEFHFKDGKASLNGKPMPLPF